MDTKTHVGMTPPNAIEISDGLSGSGRRQGEGDSHLLMEALRGVDAYLARAKTPAELDERTEVLLREIDCRAFAAREPLRR